MGFLLDKCTLRIYNEEILKFCTTFDCGNQDLNDFFANDPLNYSSELLGKTYFYYQIVRGIDNRPVQPNRATKSVSVEYTYQEDLITKEAMLPELEALCERLAERLQRHHLKGRTITVKFKFHDFTIMTRSHSLSALINDKENIIQTVNIILKNAPLEDKKVRLLGVGISNFELAAEKKKDNTPIQLKLF